MFIDFYIFFSHFTYPPTQQEDTDEEEEEEEEQEEDGSEETKVVRSSDHKQRDGFYNTIHNYFPGKIHMTSCGRHRSLINIGVPHILF